MAAGAVGSPGAAAATAAGSASIGGPPGGLAAVAARRGGTPARIDMAACPLPAFPPAARRAQAEGSSRVRFQVSAGGAVERAEVERSAGPTREHRLLDEAALRALSACRFQPGTDEAGRAVGAVAVVDYVWRLE
jgi:protein TonB